MYRDAAIKFEGQTSWVRKDEKGKYTLPDKFTENYRIEAIDASYTEIMYEGFDNLSK